MVLENDRKCKLSLYVSWSEFSLTDKEFNGIVM